MNNPSSEKEQLIRLNETFFHNIGYEHVQNICESTDELTQKYEDITVPSTLNEWFYQYQDADAKKNKSVQIKKQILIMSRKVAILFMILCVTGSIITMSVENFRIKFFNIIVETTNRFSSVAHEEKSEIVDIDALPSDWTDYYYPTFLPEGYKLLHYKDLNETKYLVFSNAQNIEIKLIQGNLSSEFQVDSEFGKSVEVDINGNYGFFIEKSGLSMLSWNNSIESFYIQGNIEKSTLLRIAESLEKNNRK